MTVPVHFTPSKSGKEWTERDRAMIAMRSQGLPFSRIGAEFGLFSSQVFKRFRTLGLPTKFSEAERFWLDVEKTETCWLWTGRTSAGGYGQFCRQKSGQSRRRTVAAHRFAYVLLRGEIPEGLQLDHLCRVRNCVNPDHLEPVTPKENILRGTSGSAINAAKTHCLRGHPLPEPDKNGRRRCKVCISEPVPCPACGLSITRQHLGTHIRRRHEVRR